MLSLFGYKIHSTARIGFSLIYPDHLVMGEGSRIGSLSVCKGLTLLEMGGQSRIGNLNWISGFPAANKTFFAGEPDRHPELVIGEHSAITNRHLIDCTNSVRIGRFTTFAGFRSQILTHSIDLYRGCQSSKPVTIGDYCFVGTNSVLLGGSSLPDCSILAASSLLNKQHSETHQVYAGNPATPVKSLPQDMAYFRRSQGYIH
ncbi:MAG TPA: hypothetical protein VM578_13085 [Candidatus Saccharimonadales bacterium]|nr:hypothetical protein [Candidatus Saccharimonadales bacterium]